MLFECLKAAYFPFRPAAKRARKVGQRKLWRVLCLLGLRMVRLARVRVYVLERGYASGLRERERERESSKLFGTTKQFDEKFAGNFAVPCASSALLYLLMVYMFCDKCGAKVVKVCGTGKRKLK